MDRSLWVAKTGLEAQQMRLATISNNLANANTTGYKAGRAEFQDLMYQNVRNAGAAASADTTMPSGLQLGTGVKIEGVQKLHGQGNLQSTENQLDIAIQGKGFFQIQLPNGDVAYSRDGSFKTNQNGDLVNSSGHLLLPGFNVPANSTGVSITPDGLVSATIAGQAAPQQLGQIQLASFINPAGLSTVGGNLFTETAASGAPLVGLPDNDGMGALNQGFLEASNVNTVEQLISMIEAQRAYEMNSKAISTSDQMLQRLANQ